MILEALVDFPDDVMAADGPLTEQHVDALSKTLAGIGIRRIVWGYYGDDRGGFDAPAGYDSARHRWANYARVYGNGRNPLSEAVAAAHRHNQEIYAYFKPYETAPGIMFPEGSPEANKWGLLDQIGGKLVWLDPFVVNHPDLRLKHQDDCMQEGNTRPIHTLMLFKKNDSPTRIRAENIEIWTSSSNYRYKKRDIPFTFSTTVESAGADVFDMDGNIITRKGAPVTTISLSNMDLVDPYVLITTDFSDGPPDFENTGTDILRAYDARGRQITGVLASGLGIWEQNRVDFREWGLIFDFGWQRSILELDKPNSSGKQGIVAFARGRNKYLPGAMCETEPRVTQFWLDCITGILDAGVDGIEFRIENHSTHTDYPEEYGFNPAVLEQMDRTGLDMPTVRGNAYTEFLRSAGQLIASRGKKMRVNLNVDWFRPDPPSQRRLAYPANIDFQWQRWIEESLMDQATLRSFNTRNTVLSDAFASEMTSRCRHAGIPLAFNHHVLSNNPWFLEEFRRVDTDDRFDSCILYETNSFTEFTGQNECRITLDVINDICSAAGTP